MYLCVLICRVHISIMRYALLVSIVFMTESLNEAILHYTGLK